MSSKRKGFTLIPHQVYDLGLKPNEGWLCIWLLSHQEGFEPSFRHIHRVLGLKYHTVKLMIPRILEKVSVREFEKKSELIHHLERLLSRSVVKKSENDERNPTLGVEESYDSLLGEQNLRQGAPIQEQDDDSFLEQDMIPFGIEPEALEGTQENQKKEQKNSGLVAEQGPPLPVEWRPFVVDFWATPEGEALQELLP